MKFTQLFERPINGRSRRVHIRVLELAYFGDSNVKDLRRVWRKNLRVCYFFENCLRSNLRTFERSFSFE